MHSFYRTSGSSPPKEHHDNRVGPDPSSGEPPLPEELVEALAGLLAEALVQDIRQYPTRPDPPAKTDTTSRAEVREGATLQCLREARLTTSVPNRLVTPKPEVP
jgi:hypothetical protein